MQLSIKLVCIAWTLLTGAAGAQVQSLFNSAGAPFEVHVYLAKPVATPAVAPVVLALHGCAGMLNARGARVDGRLPVSSRTTDYAQLLNAQGWHVVFMDSLSPRGVATVCGGKQDVTQTQRVHDVQAALAYVAAQPWADPRRIALLGFSHGAVTTLQSSNDTGTEAPAKRMVPKPVAAAVFYPACGPMALGLHVRRSGGGSAIHSADWQPAWPLLMQLGELDDWTDPKPCLALAEKHTNNPPGKALIVAIYPNAHHGFDSTQPVVFLKTIPSYTGAMGTHAGGEPAARAASQAKLLAFLGQHFK